MGYTQVGCGKAEFAATVLTSIPNMPKDKTLQIVFTGTEKPTTSVQSTSSSSSTASEEPTSTSSFSSEESSTSSKESSSSASHSPSTTSSEAPTSTTGAAPPPTSTSSGSKKSNVGAIAGGTVGGIAGLGLIAALIFFFLRSRKNKHQTYEIGQQAPVAELESPRTGSAYPGTVSSMTTPATTTPGAFSRPVSNLTPVKQQNNEPVELP